MAEVIDNDPWASPRRRHWPTLVGRALAVGALVGAGVVGFNTWQGRQQVQSAWQTSRQAADAKDYGQCLQSAQQIPAQSELYAKAQALLTHCRIGQAQVLAGQQQYAPAIAQLLALPSAHPEQQKTAAWINQWSRQIYQQAEQQYQAGNLKGAIERIQTLPAETPLRPTLQRVMEQWQQEWQRNERAIAQAQGFVREARWWDAQHALDSLSRHPYWQAQVAGLRSRIQVGIAALEQLRQRPEKTASAKARGQAGEEIPVAGLIADSALDRPYRANLARGMDEWNAWTKACQSLGGRVVDQGPEVVCKKG